MADENAKARVLVTDNVSADGLSLLYEVAEVDKRLGIAPADLRAIIGQYDALVVRSETRVTADIIEAAEHMKIIARAGVGVDNIDVEAATNRGIMVVNSPTGNVAAASEHTVALLLSLARHIPAANDSLKAGKWERSKLVGVELRNKTLGLVGLGKVGLGVARAALGLGMRVVATDPYASPDIASQYGIELTSLEVVLPRANFLTIHAPKTAATMGMIGSKELALLPQGARVLNVARGGMIDEAALLEALNSGHIAGAAIDVYPTEPPPADSLSTKLIAHPHVIATPHLGASTEEAQVQVAIDVCEQVVEVLKGGLPRAAVNVPLIVPDEMARLRPFITLAEKLGRFYTQRHHKQQQRFELIYEGDIADADTMPIRAALIKGLAESVSESHVTLVNANLIARQRGLEIKEIKSNRPVQYANLLTLRAIADGEEQVLAGAITWEEERIVRVDGYTTNFVPQGDILLCTNLDRPGMIGKVGSILGDAGINVNNMNVGPRTPDKNQQGVALMILSLDRTATSESLAAVRATDGIVAVEAVKL
jgi:D-3-phosphoglycerate dehydrogenase / 2-oxoglutarate reductase